MNYGMPTSESLKTIASDVVVSGVVQAGLSVQSMANTGYLPTGAKRGGLIHAADGAAVPLYTPDSTDLPDIAPTYIEGPDYDQLGNVT